MACTVLRVFSSPWILGSTRSTTTSPGSGLHLLSHRVRTVGHAGSDITAALCDADAVDRDDDNPRAAVLDMGNVCPHRTVRPRIFPE